MGDNRLLPTPPQHTHTHTFCAILPGGIQTQSELVMGLAVPPQPAAWENIGLPPATRSQNGEQQDLKNCPRWCPNSSLLWKTALFSLCIRHMAKDNRFYCISLVISPGPKPLAQQTNAKKQNLPSSVPAKGSDQGWASPARSQFMLSAAAGTCRQWKLSWALPHRCPFCFASVHSSM